MSAPAAIETMVVKPDEIVTALEASERGTHSVLRVTAPFNPRMRARIHVRQAGDDEDPTQLLVPPRDLLDDDCPALPQSDDTAEALRERPDEEYSLERHREAHEAAVAQWRQTVPGHVIEQATLPGVDDPVSITVLGE